MKFWKDLRYALNPLLAVFPLRMRRHHDPNALTTDIEAAGSL
jgi:hypothetical protein